MTDQWIFLHCPQLYSLFFGFTHSLFNNFEHSGPKILFLVFTFSSLNFFPKSRSTWIVGNIRSIEPFAYLNSNIPTPQIINRQTSGEVPWIFSKFVGKSYYFSLQVNGKATKSKCIKLLIPLNTNFIPFFAYFFSSSIQQFQ